MKFTSRNVSVAWTNEQCKALDLIWSREEEEEEEEEEDDEIHVGVFEDDVVMTSSSETTGEADASIDPKS